MSKRQFFLGIIVASIIGGVIAIGGYHLLGPQPTGQNFDNFEDKQNVRFSSYLADSAFTVPEGINFVHAAEMTTAGVVHIRSTIEGGSAQRGRGGKHPFDEFFKDFFGEAPNEDGRGGRSQKPSRAAGSGVIISDDGYIVTNNHVIENASNIEITLNDNRRFVAEVVGTDPTTDLALLKVDATKLSFIKFGSSDDIKIGEWVLAVGNPFDLTSTVTAGIVSAKGRNINILRRPDGRQIESFIQTDAAVNPGNSGGALVNLRGELVGINTAIATPTGSYSGYSFAVPVSIVQKVMDDLLEFGTVQRALLGINITDVNASLADQMGIKETQGVYVLGIGEGSSAEDAGIKEGDVIIAINDAKVNSVAELQERVARNRPGDKVKISFNRNGKQQNVEATLKNSMNNIGVVENVNAANIEGAVLQEISDSEKAELELEGGVKINKIGKGKWQSAGINEGFIITSVDKTPIKTLSDLQTALQDKEGGLLVEGIYPNGQKAYYGLGW